MTRYIDTAEVSKLAKNILKKQFPGFPFSVKSKRYSGGSSVTVYWTDGPTTQRVEALISHMHGAEFDGMTDLKEYNGKPYQNDYIFTQRSISDWDAKEQAHTTYILEHCKCEQVGGFWRFGSQWVSDLARQMCYQTDYLRHDTIDTAFRRAVLRETI